MSTNTDGQPSGKVYVKQGKVRPFLGRHPWVLRSAVARLEGNPADGDVVDLFSHQNRFIARGILNRQSRIQVRLYSWNEQQPLDRAFWQQRIDSAIRLREQFLADAQPLRLVFSEGDGLSGIVVDRYAKYLVVQVSSLGIAQRLPLLIELLSNRIQPQGILVRPEAQFAKSEGIELEEGVLLGEIPESPVEVCEHGLQYLVDLRSGQKTGFYLDQRDNRLQAAKYISGPRVLDAFCYTGAFSLAATKLGKATSVQAVDSSKRALELAEENLRRNGVDSVELLHGDCFDALSELRQAGAQFETVILDPPKFTRTRRGVPDALRAYHRINRLGVDLLSPGGILITCSCSGHVLREDLLHMLSGVSEQAGREIQVLEQRGAAADHPVHASCLETEYLKCFICRVV